VKKATNPAIAKAIAVAQCANETASHKTAKIPPPTIHPIQIDIAHKRPIVLFVFI